jgi:hypothetical protein
MPRKDQTIRAPKEKAAKPERVSDKKQTVKSR